MTAVKTEIGAETPAQRAPHSPTSTIPKSNVWDAIKYVYDTVTASIAAIAAKIPSPTVDNTLPRFNGTAGAMQTSNIGVDDSDNVSKVGDITGKAGGTTHAGGTGSGDNLVLRSSSHATKGQIRLGDATTGFFWDDVNQRLALGAAEFIMDINGGNVPSKHAVHVSGAEAAGEYHAHSDGTSLLAGAVLYGARSRGTEAAPTIVVDGSYLFALAACGYDGVHNQLGGLITAEVDGTPGAGDMPMRWVISVTPSGSVTPVESVRVENDGSWLFASGKNITLQSGSISGLNTPSSASDAATKSYVDAAVASNARRDTVRVATTANITISTALNSGDTIDGITLADGDIVLVKDQTAQEENGLYVVGATPARWSEYDTFDEHPGALIAVQEGSTNADSLWLCFADTGGTLGSTAITFSQLVVTGQLLAANNLNDVNSASSARSNLGLAIGSDVQAYDADTAKTDTAQAWTAQQSFTPATLTSSSNATAWDVSTKQNAKTTLTENTTITLSNGVAGTWYTLDIIQGASAYTVAWAAGSGSILWPGGTAPTISTGSGAKDVVSFYFDGTDYRGAFAQDYS